MPEKKDDAADPLGADLYPIFVYWIDRLKREPQLMNEAIDTSLTAMKQASPETYRGLVTGFGVFMLRVLDELDAPKKLRLAIAEKLEGFGLDA